MTKTIRLSIGLLAICNLAGCGTDSGVSAAALGNRAKDAEIPAASSMIRYMTTAEGHRIPVLHPPDYQRRYLQNSVEQAWGLANDFDVPADARLFSTLQEFKDALSSPNLAEAIAPLAERANLTLDMLPTDHNYNSYAEQWQLTPRDLEDYLAARLGLFSLQRLIMAEMGQASLDYQGSSDVEHIETYDVSSLSRPIAPGVPTFELDVHIAEGSGMSWEVAYEELKLAQEIYRVFGVALHVRSARKIRVPLEWQDLVQTRITGVERSDLPFYEMLLAEKNVIDVQAKMAHAAILDFSDDPDQRLHLVFLRHGRSEFFTGQNPGEKYAYPIGGSSFPPYLFDGNIDPDVQGLIGLFSAVGNATVLFPYLTPSVLAHEIAHNLVNASHEGYKVGPAHVVRKCRDLLLYGFGVDIPGGRDGRFQRERLLLSPFLYRTETGGPNADRIYNPAYQNFGHYDDPIYGTYFVVGDAR